jgi:hypothetical protein
MEAMAAVQSRRVRVHLLFALLVSEEIADLDFHGQDGDSRLVGRSPPGVGFAGAPYSLNPDAS